MPATRRGRAQPGTNFAMTENVRLVLQRLLVAHTGIGSNECGKETEYYTFFRPTDTTIRQEGSHGESTSRTRTRSSANQCASGQQKWRGRKRNPICSAKRPEARRIRAAAKFQCPVHAPNAFPSLPDRVDYFTNSAVCPHCPLMTNSRWFASARSFLPSLYGSATKMHRPDSNPCCNAPTLAGVVTSFAFRVKSCICAHQRVRGFNGELQTCAPTSYWHSGSERCFRKGNSPRQLQDGRLFAQFALNSTSVRVICQNSPDGLSGTMYAQAVRCCSKVPAPLRQAA